MATSLKILKAGNGDSLIIRFLGNDGKYKNVIIDGGNKKDDYDSYLKCELIKIKTRKECVDLMILTHTDQDHVKGIQYLLKDDTIDKSIIKLIWFNAFDNSYFPENNDISYYESCKIQNLIKELDIHRKTSIVVGEYKEDDFFGAKITLLSPLREDLNKLIIKNSEDISSYGNDYEYSIEELITKNTKVFNDKVEDLDLTIENRVSIAFLMEVNSKSILLLGDANPDIIEDSLKKLVEGRGVGKLKVDVVKLAHHASHRSLSLSIMDLIDSNQYIISANGKKANLPNKLTFAKILNRSCKNGEKDFFVFNYDNVVDNLKFNDIDFKKYNFSCFKPNYKNGYILNL